MKLFGFNIERRSEAVNNLDSLTNQDNATGFSLNQTENYINYRVTTISAIYSAIELISNSIAQLPIHIKDSKGNIVEHPVSDVFNNSLISKFMMIKQLIVNMFIDGDGIAYIERDSNTGQPVSLVLCPRGTYTITYNDNTGNLYYQIPKCSNKIIYNKDVIHIYKNSEDGVLGKGFRYYATRTVNAANSTENAAYAYFNSGCSINGILKSAKHLSKKQLNDILTAWNTAHTGTNARNIAVMPVDLDYVPLSNNAAESQLLESRLYNIQEVARFFNINPVLLGDLSHSSYSTLEASQQEFLIHTLAPIIALIEDELNRKLCVDIDYKIDIDENHMLLADKQATSSYLNTLVTGGIMTINEARHILGMQPVNNGDKLIIPYTKIEDNTINSEQEKID